MRPDLRRRVRTRPAARAGTGLIGLIALIGLSGLLAGPALASPVQPQAQPQAQPPAQPHAQPQAQPIPAAAQRYRAELVRAAHTQWGLHAPIALFAAQVHQESAWRPGAVSRVGAQGLAQFMPATATWWCARQQIGPEHCLPHHPTWALRAMVGYNRWLHQRTPAHYSAFDRHWVMLRAYNGGLGHWQAERRLASADSRAAIDAACGRARRHPLHCAENLGYPQRILIDLQPRYRAWGGPIITPTSPTQPEGR